MEGVTDMGDMILPNLHEVEEKDSYANKPGVELHFILGGDLVPGLTEKFAKDILEQARRYKEYVRSISPIPPSWRTNGIYPGLSIAMIQINKWRTAMQTLRDTIGAAHGPLASYSKEVEALVELRKRLYDVIDAALYIWRIENGE